MGMKSPTAEGLFIAFFVAGAIAAVKKGRKKLGLEGVMNFFANKTVQCIYIQASSLGWHIKHEEQKRAIQLMSPMKNGRSAHPISR